MSIRKWNLRGGDKKLAEEYSRSFGVGPLVAAVMAARSEKIGDAQEFVSGGGSFEPPEALRDMDAAVQRINRAVDEGEKIAVFGDYDVDGVTATALMCICLETLCADVVCALPERSGEGYGLGPESIQKLAQDGVSLLVTVDNGISAQKEIAQAAELGIDCVVCDHHLAPAQLPPAVAVIDPRRADDTSNFKQLAGVGVALKLAAALLDCSVEQALDDFALLVSVGTIADIMPLCGENREIVRRGLAQFAACDNIGLRELCAVADIDLESIDTHQIAFGIAPRLNAAGRIGDPHDALKLLLCDDEQQAHELAEKLNQLNAERQQIEQQIAQQVNAAIDADPAIVSEPVIVVAAAGLHPGVIGIACSRLVERYGKPAVIITVDGDEGKGSARSLRGFSIYDAFDHCRQLLSKYGGHELAAGLTLPAANIPQFRRMLNEYSRALDDMPLCQLYADCEISAADLSESAVRELSLLEPCGSGNEKPVLMLRGATVEQVSAMGNGKHTRLRLDCGEKKLSVARFSLVAERAACRAGDKVDLLLRAGIYNSEHGSGVSLSAVDIRPSAFGDGQFASYSAYRRFSSGHSARSQGVALTRADVAAVWKVLLRRRDCAEELTWLACDSGLSAGRAAAALDVLCELGLVQRYTENRQGYLRCNSGAEKKDLQDSPTFARINE